ncbi:hypothetical protein F4678DRAFT_137123 [Xylaria arbuscula]|nr:hypothetical protein F4678DRAFT_137123 [Xylaria arbuscula]
MFRTRRCRMFGARGPRILRARRCGEFRTGNAVYSEQDDAELAEQDDHPKEILESRSKLATPPPTPPPPPRNTRYNPRKSLSPKELPSTPQRPPLQAVTSIHLLTRSAPGRLGRSSANDSPRPAKASPRRPKVLTSSSKNIDDQVVRVLKKALTVTEMKETVGENYLFSVVPLNEPGRTIRKIGITTETEWERLKKISNKCKHFKIDQEVDPQGASISLFKKVESLAHAHLADRRYEFACLCGQTKGHREYFDVDMPPAQSVIQCWRAFCESKPYDANGKLRPFWDHRLKQRHKLRYWDGRETEDLSELECRLLRWEAFAKPAQSEIHWFKATAIRSKAWPWRLHIMIDALILALFVPSHLYISLIVWALIHAICMWWEESMLYSS